MDDIKNSEFKDIVNEADIIDNGYYNIFENNIALMDSDDRGDDNLSSNDDRQIQGQEENKVVDDIFDYILIEESEASFATHVLHEEKDDESSPNDDRQIQSSEGNQLNDDTFDYLSIEESEASFATHVFHEEKDDESSPNDDRQIQSSEEKKLDEFNDTNSSLEKLNNSSSMQDLIENIHEKNFIDILKGFKHNPPSFVEFIGVIYVYKSKWNEQDDQNLNLFHYLALVKITAGEYEGFLQLFADLMQKLPEEYLYSEYKNAVGKLKPSMRPLDFAVLCGSFYYVKLIIKEILVNNININELLLKEEIFKQRDQKKKFQENRQVANYIILNEILTHGSNLKHILNTEEDQKKLHCIIYNLYRMGLSDCKNNYHGLYSNNEWLPSKYMLERTKNLSDDKFNMAREEIIDEFFNDLLINNSIHKKYFFETKKVKKINKNFNELIVGFSKRFTRLQQKYYGIKVEKQSLIRDIKFLEGKMDDQLRSKESEITILNEKNNKQIETINMLKKIQAKKELEIIKLKESMNKNNELNSKIIKLEDAPKELRDPVIKKRKSAMLFPALPDNISTPLFANSSKNNNVSPRKKQAKLYVNKPVTVYFTPEQAADSFFQKYKMKVDFNNYDSTVTDNLLVQFPTQKAKGLWGEEAYFRFLYKKYEYKYQTKPSTGLTGFNIQSAKLFDGKKRKYDVRVEFPNYGFYNKILIGGSYPSEEKEYDLLIEKRIDDELLNKKYVEVKTTDKPETEDNIADLTNNERKLMQNIAAKKGSYNNSSYLFFRIYSAGKQAVSYKKIKNLVDDLENDKCKAELRLIM